MAEPAGGKLNVFISYSRDYIAFADQLRAALLAYDFAVTIDRESITSGEDWKKRLGALIRDADTIVFAVPVIRALADLRLGGLGGGGLQQACPSHPVPLPGWCGVAARTRCPPIHLLLRGTEIPGVGIRYWAE
jgi:TIR domain